MRQILSRVLAFSRYWRRVWSSQFLPTPAPPHTQGKEKRKLVDLRFKPRSSVSEVQFTLRCGWQKYWNNLSEHLNEPPERAFQSFLFLPLATTTSRVSICDRLSRSIQRYTAVQSLRLVHCCNAGPCSRSSWNPCWRKEGRLFLYCCSFSAEIWFMEHLRMISALKKDDKPHDRILPSVTMRRKVKWGTLVNTKKEALSK